MEKDRRKQGSITYFVRLKHSDLNAKGPSRQTEEDAHRDKECLVGKAVDDQRAMLQRLKQGFPQGGAGTGSVADDRDSPPTAQTPRQMKPRMKPTSSPNPGGTQDLHPLASSNHLQILVHPLAGTSPSSYTLTTVFLKERQMTKTNVSWPSVSSMSTNVSITRRQAGAPTTFLYFRRYLHIGRMRMMGKRIR